MRAKERRLAEALLQAGHQPSYWLISGYRPPWLNRLMPLSAKKSYHQQGLAVDVWVGDVDQDGRWTDNELVVLSGGPVACCRQAKRKTSKNRGQSSVFMTLQRLILTSAAMFAPPDRSRVLTYPAEQLFWGRAVRVYKAGKNIRSGRSQWSGFEPGGRQSGHFLNVVLKTVLKLNPAS